jgi:hypothetical protein
MQKIKINDKEYNIEELNDTAKTQLINIQAVNNKINSLQQEIAMLNAAKEYYTAILLQNLPKEEESDDTVKYE